MNNYTKQLKEFKTYMDACFDVLMWHGDDTTFDMFYNSEFEITFRGKKVTLANSADVYSAIECMIKNEIEEMEENM